MLPYAIFVDTSADIDKTVLQDNEAELVPMEYTVGEDMRTCRQMEDEDLLRRFYEGQRHGDLTHTSQVTPAAYAEAFEPALKAGRDVLYIALSSGLTHTMDSCMLAIRDLKKKYPDATVYPVDSLGGTGGMGLLTERAFANRKSGMTVQENQQDLLAARHRICHIFMVEDLMYLKRGGRVSATTAVIGTMLNVKPILVIDEEGKLITVAKKRGVKSAQREILKRFEETFDPSIGKRVYVLHADCADHARELADLLCKNPSNPEIVMMMLGPILGAHVGPGMFAAAFFGDRHAICRSDA
ncbi:MAG: DegV family protein [Clostridia bacterium]|nr:DegV family protein [Clostridia bacterium]